MTATTYARYEVLRTFRNRWFFVFSLAFPLLLFFLVAGPNRHETLDDIPFPLYYMAGMTAWGSMAAVVASGARIATTLIHAMQDRGARLGIATMCIGFGQGIATLFEHIE